jgi:predicted amidohydrolase YtcJ
MPPTILRNARIYTMDPGHPTASGLVIEEGVITAVLSRQEADQDWVSGPSLDLEGRVLLPGLIDSHLHLRHYAESLQKIDCETRTRQECLARVAERAALAGTGEWILGHGWNHNLWPEGYGTAAELDGIAPDRPVYLTGKSLHVSWANSRAFELAGIREDSPDPPHGSLGRDSDGRLTGILFEEAVSLIELVIPPASVAQTARALLQAQENLWKLGLTGVHDFDRELCLQALQSLEDEGQLKLRVLKSIPSAGLDRAIAEGFRTGMGSDRLWFGGVKDFVDGALGPQTAAMIEPYQGSSNTGLLMLSEDEIFQLGVKAAQGGLCLAIHAIGDLANHTLLNALERLRQCEKEHHLSPLPHRIEHLQLIAPADAGRLADLGLIASMQPIHAISDMEMAQEYWGERSAFAYAPKIQIDHGALVIFGSDAPVESPNPWLGIHAAVTRQRPDGAPGPEGWYPENRLSLDQALQGFTANPAMAALRGDRQGKLEPGYWADLVLLDRDPFQISPPELLEIRPVGTMLAGSWVFRDF